MFFSFLFSTPVFPFCYTPFLSAVSLTTSTTFYANDNAYMLPMFGVYMPADEYDASPGAPLKRQAVQLHVHGGAGARRWRAIPRVVVHVRARTSGEKQSTGCSSLFFLCKVQYFGPPLMFSTVAIPICLFRACAVYRVASPDSHAEWKTCGGNGPRQIRAEPRGRATCPGGNVRLPRKAHGARTEVSIACYVGLQI